MGASGWVNTFNCFKPYTVIVVAVHTHTYTYTQIYNHIDMNISIYIAYIQYVHDNVM